MKKFKEWLKYWIPHKVWEHELVYRSPDGRTTTESCHIYLVWKNKKKLLDSFGSTHFGPMEMEIDLGPNEAVDEKK